MCVSYSLAHSSHTYLKEITMKLTLISSVILTTMSMRNELDILTAISSTDVTQGTQATQMLSALDLIDASQALDAYEALDSSSTLESVQTVSSIQNLSSIDSLSGLKSVEAVQYIPEPRPINMKPIIDYFEPMPVFDEEVPVLKKRASYEPEHVMKQ